MIQFLIGVLAGLIAGVIIIVIWMIGAEEEQDRMDDDED